MPSDSHDVHGARDLIGIGASAGGVEALVRLVETLPAGLPAAVAVVLHIGPHSSSTLPALLARSGRLPASFAQDGVRLEPGHIYVAPPDRHMVVEGDSLQMVRGPRQNRARPSIDPLFRSGARERGRRFIGVILSGTLDDGSAGLVAVRRAGGIGVVQDPGDALFSDMPQNALDLAGADHCVKIDEMGALLDRLVRETIREAPMSASRKQLRRKGTADVVNRPSGEGPDGTPGGNASIFACPECGGVLFEPHEGQHFTCRVGHAYAPEALLSHDGERVEEALWAGLRSLEEGAILARRLAQRARERLSERSALQFTEQADEADARVRVLRTLLQGTPPTISRRPAARPAEAARARGRGPSPKRRR